MRSRVVAFLTLAALWSTSPADADSGIPGIGVGGRDDNYFVRAFLAERDMRLDLARPPDQRVYDYERTARCLATPAASEHPCPQLNPGLPPLSLTCEDGEPILPLWRQQREPRGESWQLLHDWVCPEDLLPPVTQDDLRALKIAPLKVGQQPKDGPMLITKPVIVYTEPAEREFHVVLFDYFGVDIVVTPRDYTWDFGDGDTLTTADPGRPYPNFDVTHVYEQLGEARISLTTTWTAKYRVDSDPLGRWRDADGTAITTDQGEEFEVIELRSTLVD